MIESTDRRFSVGLSFRFQLLYTMLHEDPARGITDQSLQIRRARLVLAGTAFGEHNKYKLEIAVSPTDDNLTDQIVHTTPLLEAYTEFDYLRDLTVRAGQTKVPFDRMRVVSDMARQLVDYSGATNEFSLDRDTGVELRSNDLFGLHRLRYQAGIFSGKGRNNALATDMGLLYVARVDVLPFGLFDDYVEADFQRLGPRLSVGASFVHISDAPRDRGTVGKFPSDGGTTTMNLVAVDGMFKLYGFSLMPGFYYRHGNRNPGDATDASGKPVPVSPSRDGIGYLFQAGYLLPRTSLEIVARYANVVGSNSPGHDALEDESELGGGLNYYFARHHLKLQADYFRIYSNDLSQGYDQVRAQLQFVM